jgi:hypothetical protein
MAAFLCFMTAAEAFVHCKQNSRTLGLRSVAFSRSEGVLWMGEGTEEKAAPLVTGEQLEIMLQEWDTPLVVDAYATWYVTQHNLRSTYVSLNLALFRSRLHHLHFFLLRLNKQVRTLSTDGPRI